MINEGKEKKTDLQKMINLALKLPHIFIAICASNFNLNNFGIQDQRSCITFRIIQRSLVIPILLNICSTFTLARIRTANFNWVSNFWILEQTLKTRLNYSFQHRTLCWQACKTILS